MPTPHRRAPGPRFCGVLTAVALVLLGGVTRAGAAAAPRSSDPATVLASMTLQQEVGQLFMVGVKATGMTAADRRVLARNRIGSVLLTGRSDRGVTGTARAVGRIRPVTTYAGVGPFIAADQEGGRVQVLSGADFSRIPTALAQGRLAPTVLQARAANWGDQLHRAGVNLDLGPVLDVVPFAHATLNQPIGRYFRQYGYTPRAVGRAGQAVILGMRESHVATAAKHFPGLGRATGNTDFTAGVTDPTRRGDPSLTPYATAIAAKVPFVMVSSATYPAIDPTEIAAFSPVVIQQVLRGDLGFTGVVVSDSMAGAKAVAAVRPAERALRFFRAGGDLLLVGGSAPVPAMVGAVLQRATRDPAFRARVDEAALRVLQAKASAGLVGGLAPFSPSHRDRRAVLGVAGLRPGRRDRLLML